MTAVITGITKGIGKAIAITLAKGGYDIVGCARNEEELSKIETEIKSYGVKILCVKADFSAKYEVLKFIELAVGFSPEINVLVNNIGVFIPGLWIDEDDSAFEVQQQVNINAAYYIGKRVGKMMRKQGFGHVFNICSVASEVPVENAGSYSVTKAAMLSLNHVMRRELAPYNVKVTAIIPGATYTASWQDTTLEKAKFVQPEDVAKAIVTVLQLSNGANVDEVKITPSNF